HRRGAIILFTAEHSGASWPRPTTSTSRPESTMRPHPARPAATLLDSCAILLAAAAPRTEARPVPHLDHIIVVIMENKDYATALTGTYTQTLVADASSFSGSYAIRHPSQPNYLALWAGSTLSVTSDACPPFGSPYSAENLGHACEAAGLTWRA